MSWLSDLFNPSKPANNALLNANNQLNQAYKDTATIFDPYMTTGNAAYGSLGALQGLGTDADRQAAMSRFQTSPGYDFRMQQGLDAIDRSAAARGSLMSGQTIKAAQEYGQGLASQEYGDYYNRMAGLADTGANAASNLASARLNTAAGVGGNLAQIGANKTNQSIAQGNMLSNVFGGLGKIFG
jgi:hypothetical protein